MNFDWMYRTICFQINILDFKTATHETAIVSTLSVTQQIMKLKKRKLSLGNVQGRLKIFVSAYACEPNLGSEIGVGWHWVLEMSKFFELWVLTRESNRHTIEPWIDKHPAYKSYEKILLTY